MQCFLSLVDIFAFSQNAKTLSTVNVDAPRLVFFIFQVLYLKSQFLNSAV